MQPMILGLPFLNAEAIKVITKTIVLKFIFRRFVPQLGTSSVTKNININEHILTQLAT